MNDLWEPWNISTLSPPLHASLLAWCHLHKQKNNLHHNCGLQICLGVLKAMSPWLSACSLSRYRLTYVHNFFQDSKPNSHAPTYYTSYTSSLSLHYTYGCLRGSSIPLKTLGSKGISLFYNNLQEKISPRKTNSILKWESDLNSYFTLNQ